VPAPRSWVTGDFSLLRELASSMPLIVRFQRARREACFRVVHGPDGLAGIPPQEQPMLVQQFFAGTGDALKVYVVGEQVFAVRKPSSRKDDRGIGAPCAVTPSVRDIALRCGRAFGLGVYGIDIIDGTDGPVVVELNHSPGFRGVPDVAPLLARYIEDFVRGRTILPAVLPSVSAARLQPPAVAWDMAASEPTAQGWRFPRPWAGVSCLA
jgi:ribosomal protein S6--L-glutamate ligase